MFDTFKKAWKIPELRNRIFFVLLMVIVFRLGTAIPIPGIDRVAIERILGSALGGGFTLYDALSGGNLRLYTLFAMGVSPYITASIIMQLLAAGFPSLEELQKSGEEGRKKIAKWTRYVSVGLAALQSSALTFGAFRSALLPGTTVLSGIAIILMMTAGATFLMWLGELMTEKGIGNGMSMLIFAGIIARYPLEIKQTAVMFRAGTIGWIQIISFILVAIAIVIGVIMVLNGARRIPVQYAKRMVGKTTYGGQSSFIPLKVNQAGVIPVIFASSILVLPQMVAALMGKGASDAVHKYFSVNGHPGMFIYAIIDFLLVLGFSYFYISITFNPDEVADNMKNGNGFIPGIRPGKSTSDYIRKALNRLTFVGAVFLALIAVLPQIVINLTGVPFQFGGTSLLIVVGVAIETVKQLESKTVMRQYQGFLRQ